VKILVVDDSRVMRQIIVRTLRQAGYGDYDVVEASTGAEGLQKVAEEQPAIVMSDWNMPEMNGLEFLQALRQTGDRRPFGFVTSEVTPEIRQEALRSGAAFFITKPFTPDSFATALGDAIRKAAA
jgi:two-component system chemotaxis response regulator CheY